MGLLPNLSDNFPKIGLLIHCPKGYMASNTPRRIALLDKKGFPAIRIGEVLETHVGKIGKTIEKPICPNRIVKRIGRICLEVIVLS